MLFNNNKSEKYLKYLCIPKMYTYYMSGERVGMDI